MQNMGLKYYELIFNKYKKLYLNNINLIYFNMIKLQNELWITL